MFTLHNKIAVVTGGASGIGKAIATLFAKQHAHVVLFDINEEAATAAASDIQETGGKAEFIKVSVSDESSVSAAISEVVKRHGKIDILANSAGIAHISKADNTRVEDFDKLFAVNVRGTFLTMKHSLPHMVRAHSGSIVNLASVAATVGITDRFAYSMTKGAVVSMTLSVAKDYVKEGVRCNCISPGRVHTPFVDGFLKANYPGREEEMFQKLSATQPIGRMANPNEIAALALYLSSDEASFITGCDYPIDGGFTRLNS